MLCTVCRVHVRRDFPYCLHCGSPRKRVKLSGFVAPVLVPLDGGSTEPVALTRPITTVGRAPDNDLVVEDPSVSRYHARLVRRQDGFVAEDRNSLNGVRVGGRLLHGEDAELVDGVTVEIGDVPFRFDQPRPTGVGGRTVRGAEHTMLGVAPESGPPVATERLSIRPRQRSGWALKQMPDGTRPWVLSSRSGAYLQLDDRDAFIFRCVDGENTVRDILFKYADEYGELALPRIEATLRTLASHGLVAGLPDGQESSPTGWRGVGRRIFQGLLKLEVSIGGLDKLMDRIYRRGGWRAFSAPGVVLTWVVIGIGLWAFFMAQQRQRLFDAGGAGWWGALVVGVGYLCALVVHESAHALAVKSYGRTVRRGGFMIMMGMPFAFVDTSDMWFGTRWSRVVVAMSGPVSTAALAGSVAMGAAWLPGPVAPAVCFQLAYGLYMNTAYNFNPVMPLDGYQALTDAFRVPRLRQEASAYFTRGVWRDLRARRRPGPRQLGLLLYGLAAVVGGYLFTLLGLIAWRHRLGPLVHRHVPAPWDTVILIAGIGLVTFPVWVRLARWLRRRGPKRRSLRQPPAVSADTVEVPA